MHEPDVPFSACDEPTERSHDSYALPLDQWNKAVDMAQWMSNLDTVSPLRRRMKTFLEAEAAERGRSNSSPVPIGNLINLRSIVHKTDDAAGENQEDGAGDLGIGGRVIRFARDS